MTMTGAILQLTQKRLHWAKLTHDKHNTGWEIEFKLTHGIEIYHKLINKYFIIYAPVSVWKGSTVALEECYWDFWKAYTVVR